MCKIRPTENENLLTPKRGASAYKQVWEQVPSSRRIIEDTNKFLNAIKVISDHEGRAVAGLGKMPRPNYGTKKGEEEE